MGSIYSDLLAFFSSLSFISFRKKFLPFSVKYIGLPVTYCSIIPYTYNELRYFVVSLFIISAEEDTIFPNLSLIRNNTGELLAEVAHHRVENLSLSLIRGCDDSIIRLNEGKLLSSIGNEDVEMESLPSVVSERDRARAV